LKDNDTSENYQKGNLKAMFHFAEYLGPDITFYDVKKKEQILAFLDTKIKPPEVYSEKKWITTWNDYLWRLKLFFRWLYNKVIISDCDGCELKPQDEWETPAK
jgi:integrase/recombinase XerD